MQQEPDKRTPVEERLDEFDDMPARVDTLEARASSSLSNSIRAEGRFGPLSETRLSLSLTMRVGM